jgi:hypothetical protein
MQLKSETKAICMALEIPYAKENRGKFYREAVKKLAESLMANNCLQFDEMRNIQDHTIQLRFALTVAKKPINLPE